MLANFEQADAANGAPNIMFPDKSELTVAEKDSLPRELQNDDIDKDTKIEFYEAAKCTRHAHLIRAKVIDSFYRRYSGRPDRAKCYSMLLIEIAHGELRLSTGKDLLAGYKNLGSLLNSPIVGKTLYDKLVETNWSCEATIRNPKLSYQQYMDAADRWRNLPQEEKKGHISPIRIRELAGVKKIVRFNSVERKNADPERKQRPIRSAKRNKQSRPEPQSPLNTFLGTQTFSLQSINGGDSTGVSQKGSSSSNTQDRARNTQQSKKRRLDETSDDDKPKRRKIAVNVKFVTNTMKDCLALARENEKLSLVKSIQTMANMYEIELN
jgi:hypothetical protein